MELDRRQVPFSSNRKDISRFNSPSRHPDYIDDRWIQAYDAVVALGSGVGDAEFEEALDRRPPAFDGGGQAGVGAGGKEPGQAVGGPAAKADPAISAASTLTRVIRR